MKTKDAVITLKGDKAVVRKVLVEMDKDGMCKLSVYGDTQTSEGKLVVLDVGSESVEMSDKSVDGIFRLALPVLRKSNGLEE